MVGVAVVLVLFVGNLIAFLLVANDAARYVASGHAWYAIGAYLAVVTQAIVVAAGASELVRRVRGED